jgi:hypothetical protein
MFTGLLLVLCELAAASSVAVSPTWVDGTMPAGRAASFTVTVQNHGQTPMAFETRIDDFWYDSETMKGEFPPAGTTLRSLSGQMSIFPPRLIVPADGSADFSIIVEPGEEWIGSKFASLTVSSVPYNNEPTGVRLRNRLAFKVPVLLRSAGETNYDLSVEDMGATPPVGSAPATAVFTMTNTGDTHVRPRIVAALQDPDSGDIVASLDTRAPYFLLPGQRATFPLDWSFDVPEGTYSIVGAVRFGEAGALPFSTSLVIPATAAAENDSDVAEPAPL